MTTTVETSAADSIQIAGGHYKTDFQHWNLLAILGYGHEYYTGQATKYLTRWRKKNGARDVAKAKHFIQKLIELAVTLQDDKRFMPAMPSDKNTRATLDLFYDANEVDIDTARVCTRLLLADSVVGLKQALALCEELEVEAKKLDIKDAEAPVTNQFKFIAYGDRDNILWTCCLCQAPLDLGLKQPPMLHHKCG